MIDAACYGKALFQLAEEDGNDAEISEELESVVQAMNENPGYSTLLDTPAVPVEDRLGMVRSTFASARPMLLNFLSILCEKHSMYKLGNCAAAFRACFDDAHGIMRATAITAVPLTEKQQTALKNKLEAITGKSIVMEKRVDTSLISGITLRYGGVQLDDSIKSRLDNLRRSLSETIV